MTYENGVHNTTCNFFTKLKIMMFGHFSVNKKITNFNFDDLKVLSIGLVTILYMQILV